MPSSLYDTNVHFRTFIKSSDQISLPHLRDGFRFRTHVSFFYSYLSTRYPRYRTARLDSNLW